MTITYEYGDNLYINVTNQCPNACDFCLRNNSTGSLYADNLWYEGAEPTKEEILADLKNATSIHTRRLSSAATASLPAASCAKTPAPSSAYASISPNNCIK